MDSGTVTSYLLARQITTPRVRVARADAKCPHIAARAADLQIHPGPGGPSESNHPASLRAGREMLMDANNAAVGGAGEDDGLPFIARVASTVPVNLDRRGHAV